MGKSKSAKFNYELHWRKDAYGLAEITYNQLLPMIGTALLLTGNWIGLPLIAVPLILNIRIDSPKGDWIEKRQQGLD